MKKIIMTFVGCAMSATVLASNQDTALAVNAALDSFSAQTAAGGWTASLSDIEATAAKLMKENQNFLQEYKSLGAQIAEREAALNMQRQKNAIQLAAVEAKRQEIAAPTNNNELRQQIAVAEKEAQTCRSAVSAATARLQATDSKTALLKLKVQALEVEKKALLLSYRARSAATLSELKRSIQDLKKKAAFQKEQTAFIVKKTAELMSIDRPYVKEARQAVADNVKLEAEKAALLLQLEDVRKQIDVEKEKRAGLAALPEYKNMQGRLQSKQALAERIAMAAKKNPRLLELSKLQAVNAGEVSAQVVALEGENKSLEDALSNVRENIAVLEYRLNSLTRYKNRNLEKKQ